MRVLAVEDQPEVLRGFRFAFESEGHAVEVCTTGEEALHRARAGGFDLYLIDVGLPGMSGFQVIATLREAGDRTPAIMLTAEGSEEAKVRGLEAGADDYVTKPFSVAELRARVHAQIRRAAIQSGSVRRVGEFLLDLEARTVEKPGKRLRLTNREFGLLWALAEPPIQVRSRPELLERVWGIGFDPETKVFDVHLSHLRKKLETLGGPPIVLIPEEGYLVGCGAPSAGQKNPEKPSNS